MRITKSLGEKAFSGSLLLILLDHDGNIGRYRGQDVDDENLCSAGI